MASITSRRNEVASSANNFFFNIKDKFLLQRNFKKLIERLVQYFILPFSYYLILLHCYVLNDVCSDSTPVMWTKFYAQNKYQNLYNKKLFLNFKNV